MRYYTNIQSLGSKILVREIDFGRRITRKSPYSPTLFASASKGFTDDGWRSIEGYPVSAIELESMAEARDFVKQYKEVKNFKMYGNDQFIYPYIAENYPGHLEHDFSQLLIATLDIETTTEYGFPDTKNPVEEINVITMSLNGRKLVFALGDVKIDRDDVELVFCHDEEHLLHNFMAAWKESYPDIVTGWNCKSFDIPYICARINKMFDESTMESLSPWGVVKSKTEKVRNKEVVVYNILGVAILDMYLLYRKFTASAQEEWKLDHIAEVELGRKKLDHSEYDTFKDFYTKDYNKFVAYNIVDVDLVEELNNKLHLLELAVDMAYTAKCNFEDVFSPVKTWDVMIYNYLHERKIVIPFKDFTADKDEQYEGAYVKDPVVGLHENVVSFDLNSLYPSIIRQWNISPDTILNRSKKVDVEDLLNKKIDTTGFVDDDVTMAANGQFFDASKEGFLPTIIKDIYEARVRHRAFVKAKSKELQEIEQELERRAKL